MSIYVFKPFSFSRSWHRLALRSVHNLPSAAPEPVSRSSRQLPGPLAVLFSLPDGSFGRFENYAVKASAGETKWTSLELRTDPTFLQTLISKYDFGCLNLPGRSRNGSQVSEAYPDF